MFFFPTEKFLLVFFVSSWWVKWQEWCLQSFVRLSLFLGKLLQLDLDLDLTTKAEWTLPYCGGFLVGDKTDFLFTARWSLTQSPSPRGFTCGRGCARWLFLFNSISGMDLLQGSAGIDDFPIWVQLIPRFLFCPLPISSHIDSILQGHLQCDL